MTPPELDSRSGLSKPSNLPGAVNESVDDVSDEAAVLELRQNLEGRKFRLGRRPLLTPTLAILALAVVSVTGGVAYSWTSQPPEPPPVAVAEEEEEAPKATPARVPAVRGGGRSRGSYKPQGNIADIICRPFPNESPEAWLARVPAHCTRDL